MTRKEGKDPHVFAVKMKGKGWFYAEVCLHKLKGNKEAYFSVTNGNGCAHEAILRQFPELKPLVDLHLSDEPGYPLHCKENAFFYYAEGVDDQGKRVYHASEEAKEQEQARRENEAWVNFCNNREGGRLVKELWDIWASVPAYPKKKYKSRIFQVAQECKQAIKSTITELVVPRNNQHLASHLRISLAEAEAIPPNLTKREFIDRYVAPHVERWKREAQEAIAWMESKDDAVPDKIEPGKVYYLKGEDSFRKWEGRVRELRSPVR